MKKKVANIVMVVVFAFTVICLMISSDLKTKGEFKKNGILLNGKIVDISMSSKSSSFKCEFYYKGIKMSRTSGGGVQRSTYFIGQYFPIIYAPGIDAVKILMTPEEFKEYGLKFPDSLKWVLKYKYLNTLYS